MKKNSGELKLSPMMDHYLKIKEQHKDCIIFYRLGDFYEMFFDDAIKASSLLELTLTGRDCGLKERAPMCGVPFHAADMYIDKLVSLGEKVAICEQLSEPSSKELVKRDVVRIITAGTVTNSEYIDDKKNNFILSLFADSGVFGISWLDITTGEFFTKEIASIENLFNSIIKIAPAEIIANKKGYEILISSPFVTKNILPKPYNYVESEFSLYSAEKTILGQFNVTKSSALGLKSNYSISSSGALIAYLKETQKIALSNINRIFCESDSEFMMLDYNVIRNLELVKTNRDAKKHGSLLWLLDKTKTSMGARKLQSWILSPLLDKEKIEYRLNGVEDFYNNTLVRESVLELLSVVKDIGRISGKISNGTLVPIDCIALYKSLEILPMLKFQLSGLKSDFIDDVINNLGDFSDAVKLLKASIYDDSERSIEDEEKGSKKKSEKYIKKGYNAELDELRNLALNGKKAISEFENRERERTGIRTLRVVFNRVFGYNIEITNSFSDKVPYDYTRRQTLTNAERYVTEELKDLENKLLSAQESSETLELRLYNEIKKYLLSQILEIQKTADIIAELDVILSFAVVSRERNYSRQVVKELGEPINIVDGRHPVVEAVSKQRFIPNSTSINNEDSRTIILTGPNMAGKSTYMRQVALMCIMSQIGCFVPAKSAEIPIVDKIFTRIGASDNLIFDQSTFMVEMSETADIINNATKNSLIILDEIGRGTSTYDGLSIAWALVEFFTTKIKAKTLFATHYHELTSLEGKLEGVKNYRITVKELVGSIVFTRKIERGAANESFGIEVAELAGIDKSVTKKAKEILSILEKGDKKELVSSAEEVQEKKYSQVESIIKDIDMNNLSPMQAFSILSDLQDKLREENE